jgi:hypothetical protein
MSEDICERLVRFNQHKECVSTDLEVEAAAEITRLREELYGANAEIDQFSGILADYKNAAASEAERANELNAENIALCEENARLRDLLAEGDSALSWVLLEGINEAYPTTCPVEYARIVDAAKAIAAAIREGGKG